MKSIYEQFKEGTLKEGQRVIFTGTIGELDFSDDLFPVLVDIDGNGRVWFREDTLKEMKAVGKSFKKAPAKHKKKKQTARMLRCVDVGDYDSWWTKGKLYPINIEGAEVYVMDDEGDKRSRESVETFIMEFKQYDGTVFEEVYPNDPKLVTVSTLVGVLEEDVERLNNDSKYLKEKAERILAQAAILEAKAEATETDLQTFRKYCQEEV